MYHAYITTLKECRKHSNADRLQCSTIFCNNVVLDLTYKEGQRVVYFPTDGQLSEKFARDNNLIRKKDANGNNIGGYLDPQKRNITAIRLRGEQSDGLVLPIEVLSKYTDITKLKDGDKITELNGEEICRKYIPQGARNKRKKHSASYDVKSKKKEKVQVAYPFFAQHTDTDQLAYNQDAFCEGDTCYITLKMHGTSGRTANALQLTTKRVHPLLQKIFHIKEKEKAEYQLVSGTRRTVLRDVEASWRGDNAFRKKYHDMFKDKLPKGVEIFYEIVGWINGEKTIMGRCSNKLIKDKEFSKQYGPETVFSYGCKEGESDCYVYRMTMTSPDGYRVEIPWEQVQSICQKLGVKCVPTFEKFIFTTWEDLMERVEKYYDGADPIDEKHIREGIVVRIDNRKSFTSFKHKNFSFKVLEGVIKDMADAPDIEEQEENMETGE